MVDSNDATQRQGSIFPSLHKWEEYLRLYFSDIHLIGELPIRNHELEELGRYIRNLVKRCGLTTGTQVLAERYPRAFLTFLAHTAARNEERGFWDVVAREVGVSQSSSFFQSNHHWGCLFLCLVAKLGLETFADVDSGHRYIISIRLHGGIPAYSLPDFFKHVLLPAVREHQYVGMDIPELIGQMLQRSAVQYSVDSPVRYFLEYGGETAQHFFERCLEMARIWEEQGELLSARELGLPRYIVRIFQEFMEGHQQTSKGKRLRSPRLYLEPYDPDTPFRLVLPEEPVDAGHATWRYTWHISVDTGQGQNILKSISLRVRQSGGGLVTSEEECWLEVPPGQLRVELQVRNGDSDHQIAGRWFFDLTSPPDEPPVISFRSQDGRFVRRNSTLPRKVLWLLVPAHLEVQANRGRLITEAHCLGGAWSGWKVEEWDLTGSQIVYLVDPESEQKCYRIPVQIDRIEPHLRGGKKLDQARDQEESPFFVGKPPYLWLPRLTDQPPEEEMAAWRIRCCGEGDVDPVPRETSLAALAAGGICQGEDEGFCLPLTTMLGDRPAGVYTVTVQGPRRFRSELSFRIWPALIVRNLLPYYLPGPNGPKPVHFSIQIPPEHRIAPATEGGSVRVTPKAPGQYLVEVEPDATVAKLVLGQTRPDGTEIRLPLELSVPRLRWSLRLDEASPEWTMRPISLPVDKLLQSEQAELILAWEGIQTVPQAKLLLRDTGSRLQPVLQEEEVSVSRHGNGAAIRLGIFRDTLAAKTDLSSFDLALSVEEADDTSVIPLILLRRELGVSVALLEWSERGTVLLHWEAPHRLRNRRVRIWSAWRPWEPPREYPIPDEVGPERPQDQPGSGVFELPEKLPLGFYWVAFRTAPEWEPLEAPPMPTKDSMLVECDQMDPQCRLKVIEAQRVTEKGSPFLAAFERAAIFHLQGNDSLRDREVNTAFEHLKIADPSDIIALHSWLQTLEPNLAAKLRICMYKPEQLERLLKGSFPQDMIDAYMAHFIDTEIIEPKSAQLVRIHFRNPEWQDHVTTILIKHTDTTNIQTIVEQVRQGIFSESIGLDLLAEHVEKALTTLSDMPADPLRDRLLHTLALRVQSPRVVRPGIWVRSEAGWGCVKEIWVEGRPRPYLILNEQGDPMEPATLLVELCRTKEVLQAEIDTKRGVIRIRDLAHVFRCAREGCAGFAASNQEEVRENHCRVAHQGCSPAFHLSPSEWHYGNRLEFSWDAQHFYA